MGRAPVGQCHAVFCACKLRALFRTSRTPKARNIPARAAGQGLVAGMFVIRALHQAQDAVERAGIAMIFHRADRGFGHPVAEHIFGIDPIHGRLGLAVAAGAIAGEPLHRLVPHRTEQRQPILVRFGQPAESERIIGAGLDHQRQKIADQLIVALFHPLQPQLGAHFLAIAADEIGFISLERRGQRVAVDQAPQRDRQGIQIPQPDTRLVGKGITPALIGVIADEIGIIGIQKTIRPVIQGQAQDGHIVGVHHAMGETGRLPFRHQFAVRFTTSPNQPA